MFSKINNITEIIYKLWNILDDQRNISKTI